MLSDRHELLVELFSREPEEIRSALRGLGVHVSDSTQATNHSESFNKIKSSTRSADAVWRFSRADGINELGVIIEVQLREDSDKPFTWPLYAAGLRADLRSETCVLVVTPSRQVAAWAGQPISMGAGNVFRPVVLGPDHLPLIVDEAEASRSVALAVLGVLANATSDPENTAQAALVATKACLGVSNRLFIWCYDAFFEALSGAALALLEKLMDLDVRNLKTEFSRRHVALGEVQAIVGFLTARGLTVTTEQRERILACTDLDTIATWVAKAAIVASTDELFAE